MTIETKEQVRAAREKLGLTQKELAERLRIKGPYAKDSVRAWESGKTPIPGPAAVALEFLTSRQNQG